MNTQTIKQGDIVRLTDPISNGEVVRIESVDEHCFASWFGGAQKGDMTQISVLSGGDSPIGNDIFDRTKHDFNGIVITVNGNIHDNKREV